MRERDVAVAEDARTSSSRFFREIEIQSLYKESRSSSDLA
jgi:hypothetical protein